jgi:hypothetical protein
LRVGPRHAGVKPLSMPGTCSTFDDGVPTKLSPAKAGLSFRRAISCVENEKAPPASRAQGNRQPMRFSGYGLKRVLSNVTA